VTYSPPVPPAATSPLVPPPWHPATPAIHCFARPERRVSYTGWNAVFYLDLQNVLNRKNAVGFAYTESPEYPNRIRPIDGAGLLPTFGFNIEF
jgi:hypothetical protein